MDMVEVAQRARVVVDELAPRGIPETIKQLYVSAIVAIAMDVEAAWCRLLVHAIKHARTEPGCADCVAIEHALEVVRSTKTKS